MSDELEEGVLRRGSGAGLLLRLRHGKIFSLGAARLVVTPKQMRGARNTQKNGEGKSGSYMWLNALRRGFFSYMREGWWLQILDWADWARMHGARVVIGRDRGEAQWLQTSPSLGCNEAD